jgi:hypothetical protein
MIEFLVARKQSVRNIHKHLCDVSGSAVVYRRTGGCWAKWAMASEVGKSELRDLPCQGCLATAVSPEMLQCADSFVSED